MSNVEFSVNERSDPLRTFIQGLLILVFALGGGSLSAQGAMKDPVNRLIWDMFQEHRGKTLCSEESVSLETVRFNVIAYLKTTGSADPVTPEGVGKALWELYPCPFSPYRIELRPATRAEVEGVWIFPKSSQLFRFGPRATQPSPGGPLPVSCEAVGYYPDGELRQAIMAGRPCPFHKGSDLDIARKKPRVSDWNMIRDGRIAVTRTDVKDYVEEWEAFTVNAPFSVHGVRFSPGDVLEYLRREKGNEMGAATQFRHLQRLPQ